MMIRMPMDSRFCRNDFTQEDKLWQRRKKNSCFAGWQWGATKYFFMGKPLYLLIISIFLFDFLKAQQPTQRLEPVNFSQVTINDNFWKPKIDKVATKTLAAFIYQTEITPPQIRNFEKVARKKG